MRAEMTGFLHSHIPRIATQGLPQAEHPIAITVDGSLQGLLSFLTTFEHDVQLMNYCLSSIEAIKASAARTTDAAFEQRATFNAWASIAGRDAALNVWHFGMTIDGLARLITHKSAPSLNSRINHRQRKLAWQFFRESFPAWEAIRHSVAHSAEITETPQKYELTIVRPEHSQSIMSGGSGGMTIKSGMRGSSLMYSVQNEIKTLDVNGSSVSKLATTLQMFCAAYEALEAESDREARISNRDHLRAFLGRGEPPHED